MAVNGVNGVFSNAGYNFGSVASIRKQAEEIRQRAAAQRDARIAEQDKTGLIKNPRTGEMVELSSISEETRNEWNDSLEMQSLSIREVMILFDDADPHLEEIEKNKELAAKATKLQNKMFSGKTLTGAEKKFLRDNNFTWLADTAERMEQEAKQLKTQLARCKSKDEARQVYINAKARLVGGADKNDGSALFLSPALDEVYSQYMGRGSSKTPMLDIWA